MLDVVLDDPEFAERSQAAIEAALGRGKVIVCPIVDAECAAAFARPGGWAEVADAMGLSRSALSRQVCEDAGLAWRRYRQRGGRRTRIISDFLIGAHAHREAGRLLTRDRGFFRDYFDGLRIIAP